MKTVYLVRHAKSSWKIPALADHDRPLNKRGKYDAPRMGKLLRKMQIEPDLLHSSTANRALTTAKTIARELGFSENDVEEFSSLFHASAGQIAKHFSQLPEDAQSVMMFGHNPGTTSAANRFGSIDIANVPTCGVVALQWPDANTWEEASRTVGETIFYEYPKKHFYDALGHRLEDES